MIANDEIRALLDQAPSQVDIRDLERAESACDAAIGRADRAIADLHHQIEAQQEILREAERDRENIASYRAFVLRFQGLSAGNGSTETEAEAEEAHRGPSGRGVKRTAIIEYLSDGATRHRDEIRERLIARGIMRDTDAETHTLNVTLSRMFRNGELERPRKGFYKLPSASADGPSPDDAQEVLDA